MNEPQQVRVYDGRPFPFSLDPGIDAYECPVCGGRTVHVAGTRAFRLHLAHVPAGDVVRVPRRDAFDQVLPSN